MKRIMIVVCFFVIRKLYFNGNLIEIRCFMVILNMFEIEVINEMCLSRLLDVFNIFINVEIFFKCVSWYVFKGWYIVVISVFDKERLKIKKFGIFFRLLNLIIDKRMRKFLIVFIIFVKFSIVYSIIINGILRVLFFVEVF